MDKKEFGGRVKRLKEVNSAIEGLDETIRLEAFKLLQSYITGKPAKLTPDGEDRGSAPALTDMDASEFFTQFTHDKPSDNVLLVAAYHYSQYGTTPVSIEDIKATADDVGITVPARIDMTLISSKRDGKSLLTRAGRGKFKPTVHGEKFFKETYGVAKGKKQKPSEA